MLPLAPSSPEDLNEDLLVLQQVYPCFDRDQLLQAKETLDGYFDLAVSICLRLAREEDEAHFDNQAENSYAANGKVDFPTINQ